MWLLRLLVEECSLHLCLLKTIGPRGESFRRWLFRLWPLLLVLPELLLLLPQLISLLPYQLLLLPLVQQLGLPFRKIPFSGCTASLRYAAAKVDAVAIRVDEMPTRIYPRDSAIRQCIFLADTLRCRYCWRCWWRCFYR